MELSNEDALRLNVLLASQPQAIRLNESDMSLRALTDKGEVKIRLNPTCKQDRYLRLVREALSGHVLGSPGGYPVYLRRWTRMGQMRDESLEQLLLLAEPEAVVAAVCAAGLTDELARRIWWIEQTAEHARRMLNREAVIKGRMGKVLAQYLVDHLAFETEPESMVETVQLILQPGLVDEEVKLSIWKKGGRKPPYLLGFLVATPDELPGGGVPREDWPVFHDRLLPLARSGNPYARVLLRVLSAAGQTFLATCVKVLKKPANQEVVTILLGTLATYFEPMRPGGDPDAEIDELARQSDRFIANPSVDPALRECLSATPALVSDLRAMHLLSGMGYGVVRPVFKHTTAIGSLMRRKLEPITGAIENEIQQLRTPSEGPRGSDAL